MHDVLSLPDATSYDKTESKVHIPVFLLQN